ncbi:MAG: hypothetical protein IJ507_03460, partial [Clostridia bacterium]|nr:hypothetical protein [Clostridia bacterium]
MNELDLSASLTLDVSDFDRKVQSALQSGKRMQQTLTAQLDAVNQEISGVLGSLKLLTAQAESPLTLLRAPAGANLPSHATGLDYVPFNDYRARLHEGEAVLTKLEATEWRRGGGMTLDSSALA